MKKQIRVLVVDDSSFIRELIRSFLSTEPDIQVAGEASNGKEAIEQVVALKPDLVTMDIEMPVLGGLEAIEQIMSQYPVPILVITALTGVKTAFAAVSKGALDVIEKPDISSESADRLIEKIRKLARVDIHVHLASLNRNIAKPVAMISGPPLQHTGCCNGVVAVAASTGGPQAISRILSGLPVNFPLPILITMHIADGFTQGMVDWLTTETGLKVVAASSNTRILPGHVYINPAESSMVLAGDTIQLGRHPEKSVYHPSCDTMLKSVADSFKANAIGCILSGMGNDGVEGMGAVKAAGGLTLAQDAGSSVIYGMNREAVEKGYINQVLPVSELAAFLTGLTVCSSSAASVG